MIKLLHNHPIDFSILKDLYQHESDLLQAWPGAKYPLCPKQWQDTIDASLNSASLLFVIENKTIGHLVLKSNDQAEMYICFLLLTKDYRGNGYIYQMLELAEEFTMQNYNYDRIWLHVNPENLPAFTAYKKYGFSVVSTNETGSFKMVKLLENKE